MLRSVDKVSVLHWSNYCLPSGRCAAVSLELSRENEKLGYPAGLEELLLQSAWRR